MISPIINYDQLTKMVGRNETSISNEIARAKEAETDLGNNITHAVNVETVRATEAEADLDTRLKEVSGIAKGATRAKTFLTYAAMVEELLQTPSDTYNPGQGFLIATVNVPDLWVYGIVSSYNEYEFQSDEDFVNELKSTGVVHIGYFLVSALETQKVDLSTYVEAYVGVEGAPISNPCSGTSVYYDNTYGWGGIAYLSSTIPLTKEQLIGTKWTLAYIDTIYTPTEHEITKAHLKQETDDGLWFCVDKSSDLHIFVAYNTNFKPDICSGTLPAAGVYLSESYIEYSPYIVNVTPWLSPRKQIDNRLINLKEHPDFIIPEPDMADYVKKTDYAGEGKAGVIKTSNSNGGCTVLGDGTLYFFGIQDREWAVRDTGYAGSRHLRLSHVDDIVKYGLTDNKKTLTDEEKASAKTWLGVPKYFSDLEYKPFGGHEEISISFSDAGESVYVNGFMTYLQTTKVYPPDVFVGAHVSYYDEQHYSTEIMDGFIKSRDEKGYTIQIGSAYIYCVYDVNYLGASFPSTGIYFSYFSDGDDYYVEYVYKAEKPISYLNNAYLDLANHQVIKLLLARIEALENK